MLALAQRAMNRRTCAVFLGLALVGCLDGEKGPEEEVPEDGKLDSFRSPTDHGAIDFGVPATSVLTDTERHHTWVFELSDTAKVNLVTSYAVLGQRRTDTVLYLYRETDGSWGPYLYRNDDYGSTTYSKLTKELGPGRYRALVKGHFASTRGKFKLTASCEGPGCVAGCLFGSVYRDAFTAPSLQVLSDIDIDQSNLDTLGPDLQAMLVRAVHESSHTDATTPQDALSRVDQEEMNVTFFADAAGQRSFVAFEYGAGDNSYGAFFNRTTGERASSIHDGDLYNCAVQRATCKLPDDYPTLRSGDDASFTQLSTRSVTMPQQLDAAEMAQATKAMPLVYGEPKSVDDGIAQSDDNAITVATYRHSSGKIVTVYQWYAGDTSVGAMFHGTTTDFAGVINDSAIEGCSLF